jgi:hypothetical protein
MQLVPVTTVNDAGQANLVRGVLEEAGIRVVIGGSGMEAVYPTPSVNPLQILVTEADLRLAQDILAQFETTPDDGDDE